MSKTVCGVMHPDLNLRCTKKPDHYPKTKHGNQKPGAEVEWVSETAIEHLKRTLIGKTITITGVQPNEPNPLEVGDLGIVSYVDDGGTIWANWKSGRTLGVLPTDPYEVVS